MVANNLPHREIQNIKNSKFLYDDEIRCIFTIFPLPHEEILIYGFLSLDQMTIITLNFILAKILLP